MIIQMNLLVKHLNLLVLSTMTRAIRKVNFSFASVLSIVSPTQVSMAS